MKKFDKKPDAVQLNISFDENKKETNDFHSEIEESYLNEQTAESYRKEEEKKERNEIASKYNIVNPDILKKSEKGEWCINGLPVEEWHRLMSDNDDLYDPEKYWEAKKKSELIHKNEEQIRRAFDRDNLK